MVRILHHGLKTTLNHGRMKVKLDLDFKFFAKLRLRKLFIKIRESVYSGIPDNLWSWFILRLMKANSICKIF